MSTVIHLARTQFIASIAVLIALASAGYAATGKPFILGTPNSASSPTMLQNTGPGVALDLRAKAGQPALKVNTSALIPGLNAARLNGNLPSAFARAGSVYSKATVDSRFGRSLASGGAGDAFSEFNADVDVLFDKAVAVPGPGFLLVILDATSTGGDPSHTHVWFNGMLRDEFVPGALGTFSQTGVHVAAASNVPVQVTFTADAADPSTADITFSVVWVPDVS